MHDAFETDERLLRLDADEISATSPAGGLAPTLDFEDEVRPLVYLALVDCAQAFPGSVTDEELRAARELAASAIERLKARGAPDWI